MFTGIVTDIGEVLSVDEDALDRTIKIKTSFDMHSVEIGASIACSGCCLTVTAKGDDWFDVQVSNETLSKTNIGSWQKGSKINLERSLKMGDELGGHMVTGHIDGLAKLEALEQVAGSHKLTFKVPGNFAKYIAQKGSITLDGISLTVNEVDGTQFSVNIIPHTWAVTTFASLKVGDSVHMEVDIMARYIQRALECDAA